MKKLLLLPLLLLPLAPLQAAVETLDGIAAVVDDDVITRGELQQRLQQLTTQLRQKGTQLPPASVLQRQLLERMIVEKLQLAQAKEVRLSVDDEELNKVIERIAADNKLTLLQFRSTLEKDGIGFASFREEIRNEILISRLRAGQVNRHVNVSPQEVDNLLEAQRRKESANEELHLQHILIALPSDASPEQLTEGRDKARQLLEQLRGGADFASIAVSHSAGPRALEGGDIGWRRLAQLPVAFAQAVEGLAVGGVSEPVRSSSGFHLFKLMERRGEERHLVRQVSARHILIATSPLVSDREAEQRLLRLRERILAGENFAELARAHSSDTGSAAKGGELGWADPAIYVESFRNTIKNTQPGEISRPFKSEFGWHILQVHQWRQHDDTEEFARNRAFEALQQRKIAEETESWLRRLRDEAYVEIRLD